jgi:hypothetical protein
MYSMSMDCPSILLSHHRSPSLPSSSAHVYDVMRSQLPTLELDAVFEAKEELALAVKNALSETMTGYVR